MNNNFDPLNVLDVDNSDFNLEKFKERGEDICQYSSKDGLIIDLGYYNNIFKIHVIKNENWNIPVEVHQSNDLKIIIQKFRDLVQENT